MPQFLPGLEQTRFEAEPGALIQASSWRERWIALNEPREARGAVFVHAVIRRSFADAATDVWQLNQRLREVFPPRARAGRNHSAALIEDGSRVLTYESRGLRGVKLLDLLRECDGFNPPNDSHSHVGPADANWLSTRRRAARRFAEAIGELGGTPPAWLAPSRS
jgi:hypothetical protein